MSEASAFAAFAHDRPLAPFRFDRRDVGAGDVLIDILFCGVCHSDLHVVRNDWGGTVYPSVPGHEIVGRVSRVGGNVTKFAPGDVVGIGGLVGSCRTCPSCQDGLEQYCEAGATFTLGSPDPVSGGYTMGGFSDHIVVDQDYVVKVSHDECDLAAVAPLLCAGITTYSPLKHWKAGPGQRVGVVGLGGLGHMAVKIAAAFGATVVVLTRSDDKREDALALGAHEVVVSTDPEQMAACRNSLDLILDTVSASHDLDAMLMLLKRDGTLVLLGVPGAPHPSPSVYHLVIGRRSIAGTNIGGIAELQEMLDFCSHHGLAADIELIGMPDINQALDRLEHSDVKYRFVIDMKTLREQGPDQAGRRPA